MLYECVIASEITGNLTVCSKAYWDWHKKNKAFLYSHWVGIHQWLVDYHCECCLWAYVLECYLWNCASSNRYIYSSFFQNYCQSCISAMWWDTMSNWFDGNIRLDLYKNNCCDRIWLDIDKNWVRYRHYHILSFKNTMLYVCLVLVDGNHSEIYMIIHITRDTW